MGDFAESIRKQTGQVVAATKGTLAAAQEGLTADLTTTQRLVATGSASSSHGDSMGTIEALLRVIANKRGDTYMDADKVSSALYSRSKIALARRGIA